MSGEPTWREVRRIVTGLDREGQSCVLFDGPIAAPQARAAVNIWHTATLPADNTGTADQGSQDFAFDQLGTPGSSFLLVQHPPGFGRIDPQLHAADTLSLVIIVSGEITLVLETVEVPMRAGDVLVERGVIHGWRNTSDVPAVSAVATVPALPVRRTGQA